MHVMSVSYPSVRIKISLAIVITKSLRPPIIKMNGYISLALPTSRV